MDNYQFLFTKGPNTEHLTPTGPANFSNISLDWMPNTTSVEENANHTDIHIFPNPTNGIFTVNYKDASRITVENILGSVIYDEKINTSGLGRKTIDLSKYSNGTYFIKVQTNSSDKVLKYKVLLNK